MYWVATQLGSSYKGSPMTPEKPSLRNEESPMLEREGRLLAPGEHWSARRGSGRFGTTPDIRLRSDERIRKTIERFSIPQESGCVLWTGNRNKSGYGTITIGYNDARRSVTSVVRMAHVVAWELEHGPVPNGLELDHFKCRTRHCIRTACLRPVTHTENMRNGAHALKTHCPRGHEYAGENLSLWKTKGGVGRHCKACNRARAQDQRDQLRRREAQEIQR